MKQYFNSEKYVAQLDNLKSQGYSLKDFAKMDWEICDDWQYGYICLDQILMDTALKKRQTLERWIYENYGEDCICMVFSYLDGNDVDFDC